MRFAARRHPILPLLTLGLGLACAVFTPAAAETIVHKSITYFTIGGRTAAELDQELQRNGPLLKTTGTRHPGATRIKFGGDVTYVEENGICRISAARVTVTTKIMLPKWRYRRTADARLGLLWDTLSSDIRRHEERHAEIARTHAREMERTLKTLPSRDSCKTLQAEVSRISGQLIQSHDRDQAQFDKVEAANFESRMIRLLNARLASQKAAK